MSKKKSPVEQELEERARERAEALGRRGAGLENATPLFVTEHIARLTEAFSKNMKAKYLAGQVEHGGDLSTKESIMWLLQMMEDEAIDQFVYVRTLRERIIGKE
jgi:hypothetical protein